MAAPAVTTSTNGRTENSPTATITLPGSSTGYVLFVTWAGSFATQRTLSNPTGWAAVFNGAPVSGEEAFFGTATFVSTSGSPGTTLTFSGGAHTSWTCVGLDAIVDDWWYAQNTGNRNGASGSTTYPIPALTAGNTPTEASLLLTSLDIQYDAAATTPPSLPGGWTLATNPAFDASAPLNHVRAGYKNISAGATSSENWTATFPEGWGWSVDALAVSVDGGGTQYAGSATTDAVSDVAVAVAARRASAAVTAATTGVEAELDTTLRAAAAVTPAVSTVEGEVAALLGAASTAPAVSGVAPDAAAALTATATTAAVSGVLADAGFIGGPQQYPAEAGTAALSGIHAEATCLQGAEASTVAESAVTAAAAARRPASATTAALSGVVADGEIGTGTKYPAAATTAAVSLTNGDTGVLRAARVFSAALSTTGGEITARYAVSAVNPARSAVTAEVTSTGGVTATTQAVSRTYARAGARRIVPVFRPPQVKAQNPDMPTALPENSNLFNRMALHTPLTVIKSDGLYRAVIEPDETAVKNAEAVYLGGRDHYLTQDEAADLEAAGYGPYIAEAEIFE